MDARERRRWEMSGLRGFEQKAVEEVVIIRGSHRGNGNTSYWVDGLLEQLHMQGVHPQVFDVRTLHIEPCIDCSVCRTHWGQCTFSDDMNAVYAALQTARVLVIAAPVYYNGLPGRLKTLVDRCQMLFMCDFSHHRPYVHDLEVAHKRAYLISAGGAPGYAKQFVGNEATVELLLNNLRMPLTAHVTYSGTDGTHLSARPDTAEDFKQTALEIVHHIRASHC